MGLLAVVLIALAVVADDAWFQLHMMHRYCVVDPASLPRAHVGRGALVALGLFSGAIVRPRLGRWAGARSPKTLAAATLRILGAIVLALVAVDVVLRLRGRKPPPFPPRFVLRDGLRTRSPGEVPDLGAKTVLFSGESVVWGHGLGYDETIPALVAAHTGIATVNLGVKGFGNDDALGLLESQLPRFEHPVAVVSFVVYNWIERNVMPGSTRLVLGPGGTLEKAPPESWSLLGSSPLFAVLHSVIPYREGEAVELTRAIMRRTAELTRARGAFPLFVLTQCGVRCRDTGPDGPWLAARLAEDQPFTSIRVELDPAQELPGDGHPNPHADERYAAAIEHALRDAHVLP